MAFKQTTIDIIVHKYYTGKKCRHLFIDFAITFRQFNNLENFSIG